MKTPTKSLLAISMISILGTGCASRSFVRVDAGQFVIGSDVHRFVGVNFWQAVHLAAKPPIGDRTRLAKELDTLQSLGISNIRILAAFEGPSIEPYRVRPALMESPGVYNENVFDGLDYLLAELSRRNMHAVVALTNFWEWSGGMAQYVSWYEKTPIPYPATNDWREFCAYATKFYDCDPCRKWFHEHITTIVNRVNPYTHLAYRDDPAIFAWELANEPRYYPQAWIDDTAAFIKSLDPNHLVTTGSEGEVGGEFIPTHDGDDIDYTCIHIWPQNWGWFDPTKPSTFDKAMANASDYFQRHEKASSELGKPMVLEEFGLARDWLPRNDCYDPQSTTDFRDRFFQAMFENVSKSAATGGSAAGSNIWVWTGHSPRTSGHVGDPPHETPGWYSVYVDDKSTLQIMKRHAQHLGTLVQP